MGSEKPAGCCCEAMPVLQRGAVEKEGGAKPSQSLGLHVSLSGPVWVCPRPAVQVLSVCWLLDGEGLQEYDVGPTNNLGVYFVDVGRGCKARMLSQYHGFGS